MDESLTMSNWSFLPPDIMVHVIELLDDPDRYNLSLTCKKWNEVSKTGCLWRRRSYVFRGYCQNKEARIQGIRQCIRSVGHHIKHLQLICHSPNLITASNIAACVRVLCMELCGLPRGRTTLESLVVKDLDFDETWKGFRSSRDTLVFSLANLILYQRRLKTLDLSNAFLSAPYACSLLEAVIKSRSVRYLQNVNIENFFSPSVSQTRCNIGIHMLLGTAIHARRISLNLSYLQDRSLLFLCAQNFNALRQLDLHISCKNNGAEIDSISPETWKIALLNCPDLKVTLSMDHWPQNPVSYIKPELPLIEFHLKGFLCGTCKASYVSKIVKLLNYLSEHFSISLTKMSFLLKFGKNPITPPIHKELVMNFLSQCPRLRILKLSHSLISLCNDDSFQMSSIFPKGNLEVNKTRSFTIKNLVDSRGVGYSSFLVNANKRHS